MPLWKSENYSLLDLEDLYWLNRRRVWISVRTISSISIDSTAGNCNPLNLESLHWCNSFEGRERHDTHSQGSPLTQVQKSVICTSLLLEGVPLTRLWKTDNYSLFDLEGSAVLTPVQSCVNEYSREWVHYSARLSTVALMEILENEQNAILALLQLSPWRSSINQSIDQLSSHAALAYGELSVSPFYILRRFCLSLCLITIFPLHLTFDPFVMATYSIVCFISVGYPSSFSTLIRPAPAFFHSFCLCSLYFRHSSR